MTPARARSSSRSRTPDPVRDLRARLDLSRSEFSRLLGFTERAVASWEAGRQAPGNSAQRSLVKLERLLDALERVMKPEAVGPWFLEPNDAFDGFKPVELVERGMEDRIWHMVFALEAGIPV